MYNKVLLVFAGLAVGDVLINRLFIHSLLFTLSQHSAYKLAPMQYYETFLRIKILKSSNIAVIFISNDRVSNIMHSIYKNRLTTLRGPTVKP